MDITFGKESIREISWSETFEKLQNRERQLINQLVPIISQETAVIDSIKSLEKQLLDVLEQKQLSVINLCKELLQPVKKIEVPSSPTSSSSKISTPGHSDTELEDVEQTNPLVIIQQPSQIVSVNRYLYPHPSIKIAEHLTAQYNSPSQSLAVSVNLVSCNRNPLSKEFDNLDGLLGGPRKVIVNTSSTIASFSKLKILEIPVFSMIEPLFCLEFTLSVTNLTDYSSQILSVVRSTSFLVHGFTQSPPKRKRIEENILEEVERSPPQSYHHNDNFVDITHLLGLPQKEAAQRLGISESMLCKRFKEQTKRKWPYRCIAKVDKQIYQLQTQQSESPTRESEQQKIEKLKKERELCFLPVKIRITHPENLSEISSPPTLVADSTPPQVIPSPPQVIISEDSTEFQTVLESLAMLRRTEKL